MKWFKHQSDSLHDPFIYDLINEFGSDGYLAFFGILEIYSKEFDGEIEFILQVSLSFLSKNLQISTKKLNKILSFISENGNWGINRMDNRIEISIRKFTDLLDDYTLKKIREYKNNSVRNTGQCNDKVSQEKEKEEDKEKNKIKSKKQDKIFSSDSDEYRLSELLLSLIREHKPDYKQPNIQKWAYEVDLTIRRDNRNIVEIENVILWCQRDSFWRTNILSTAKLREKYDQLCIKMNQDTQTRKISEKGRKSYQAGQEWVKNMEAQDGKE